MESEGNCRLALLSRNSTDRRLDSDSHERLINSLANGRAELLFCPIRPVRRRSGFRSRLGNSTLTLALALSLSDSLGSSSSSFQFQLQRLRARFRQAVVNRHLPL